MGVTRFFFSSAYSTSLLSWLVSPVLPKPLDTFEHLISSDYYLLDVKIPSLIYDFIHREKTWTFRNMKKKLDQQGTRHTNGGFGMQNQSLAIIENPRLVILWNSSGPGFQKQLLHNATQATEASVYACESQCISYVER